MEHFLRQLNQLISWSALNKIQNIWAVKSMYVWLFVVPIIAKLLSKLEDVANLTIFQYSFELQLGLPFSWKIFYFSALCFAIANLIFVGRCHSIIKDHTNFNHFEGEGKTSQQLYRYGNEMGFTYDDSDLVERTLKELFWDLYETSSLRRTFSRIICTIFYVAGFILIGWVILQNLKVVLKIIS